MPLFDFRCGAGHVTERLASFGTEVIVCACGLEAPRVEVNRILFGFKGAQGEKLSSYHDAAREMEYQVSRSDDPSITGPGTRIAHAAKVRAEGQMLAGATTWAGGVWNPKEVS